ncbi:uncharacterized protein [Onthophagus taurus]|uniref:uncharacterized protein n=1 Tax=Onthophagus taurus TaxID=166361 RepID=UPI000C201882|nr:uncharacterized protein LOC111417731 [Onthophagus taurus]XP_022912334.1 uncharacterized protein LOC111423324 [Onthophagus taurus]
MSCLGDCLDLGPPPDTILFLPPPPIPSFLQPNIPDLITNGTPCSSPQLCENWLPPNKVQSESDYIELHRKEIESWSVSGIDDTWLLVLVASSIGVLLLGALLAMFLLKCREMNMFGHNECSVHVRDVHRPIKPHEPRDCSSMNTMVATNKLLHPSETVLYHPTAHNLNPTDNRMVWAALTPRGTQHFISETFPRDLVDYVEADDHYETIENVNIKPTSTVNQLNHHQIIQTEIPDDYQTYTMTLKANKGGTFENNGFVDYDYEDPTPLIESYQLDDMEHQYAVLGGNTDMRCSSLGLGLGGLSGGNSLRRGFSLRPEVSSPTRIENPNLPPLNLYPHNKSNSNTFRRNTTMTTYRPQDVAFTHKYGC